MPNRYLWQPHLLADVKAISLGLFGTRSIVRSGHADVLADCFGVNLLEEPVGS